MQYDAPAKEVPVTLTPAEVRALLEAAQALDYTMPGLTSATKKLKAARK